MSKVTLNLRGMHCASCASSIQSATRSIYGVASSNVNFATEEVMVEFDDKKTSASAIGCYRAKRRVSTKLHFYPISKVKR